MDVESVEKLHFLFNTMRMTNFEGSTTSKQQIEGNSVKTKSLDLLVCYEPVRSRSDETRAKEDEQIEQQMPQNVANSKSCWS